jgi:hypothetical protein
MAQYCQFQVDACGPVKLPPVSSSLVALQIVRPAVTAHLAAECGQLTELEERHNQAGVAPAGNGRSLISY